MERGTARELFFLVVLCLTAALLRFHRLGDWSPSGDEVYTMVEARHFALPLRLDRADAWTLATNPLSHLFTGIAYTLMGETPFAARVPAALFGLLAVPVFYLLVRRRFGIRIAFLTALFVTFSPNLVFLSGFARYNSMVFFFGGTAFLLCLSGLVERRGGLFAGGVGCSVLAVLCHITAVFVPLAVAVTAFAFAMGKGEHRRFYGKALAGVVLPYFLGALFLVHPLCWNVRIIFRDFFGKGGLYPPERLLASIAYNDGPVHFVSALGALAWGWRRRRVEVLAVGCLWFMPLAVMTVAAIFFRVGPRYLHAVLPGYYLLAAVGAGAVLDRFEGRSRWIAAAVPLFFLVWQIPLLASHWEDGSRYDTRSATRFLESWHGSHPEDPIFAEAHMVYDYLSGGRLPVAELPVDLPGLLRVLEDKESAVIVFPRQRGRPLGFAGRRYRAWLKEHCRLLVSFSSRRFDLKRYEVVVYRYVAEGASPVEVTPSRRPPGKGSG